MKHKIIALLFLFTAFAMPAIAVTEEEITSNLNCPDKEGCTMIAVDCTCPSSLEIKDKVRAMLDQGLSEKKIYDKLSAEYGREVLATPPKEGFDWIIWVALPAGIIVGGVVVYKISRKRMDENEIFEYEYEKFLKGREKTMNRLLLLFIMLALFGGAASAAEIGGNVISDGKKLSGLAVTLSRINGTSQSEQSMTGVVYDFMKFSETTTDKNGSYAFNDINNGMYRINVTYNGTIYGENIGLKDRAIVNFNLSGKIEGYVLKVNKTLEGIPIRLLDAGGIEVMGTTTGKSGKYSFNKVDAGKGYFVEAMYADVPYTKQVNASESADFVVYEPTKDGDVISVSVDHIVLSKAPTGIKVDEYVEFINTGDKVFYSKDRTWLGIFTPQGISRFQTDAMECCLQREKDAAWIDPMVPIMPGETYSTQISYILNADSPAPTFSKGMIYNTSYMSLLSEKNNGFGIESKYATKEIVPSEGKEFEVLSFMNVPKGQIIDTQITGYVPSKTGIEGDFNYLIPIVAVVLIGAVSYPLLKNKIGRKQRRRLIKTSSPVSPVQAEGSMEVEDSRSGSNLQSAIVENVSGRDIGEMSFDQLLTEKKAAFESILALDNKFNSGEISNEEYKELKKEYKERSIAVIKQLKEAALNLDLNQPVPEIEKVIAYVDDVDILEELLEREKEGENRDEIKKSIELRIDDIEQNE